MINEQIVSYIRTEFAQGVTRESAKQALLEKGWPPQDVEDAFYAFDNPSGGLPNPQETLAEKEKKGKNKWALLSCGFSVVGILLTFIYPSIFVAFCALLGFILGFVGLGSQKRGLSIVGIILSSLLFLLLIIGLIAIFSGTVPSGETVASSTLK